MSTPVTPVTKATKTWITTVGAVLAVVVPLATSALTYLPPEWAAVITGVIGVLTVLGVYTVPNKPTGSVVVHADTAVPDAASIPPGVYANPWES
jgi:hypothetical protein